MKRIIFSLCFVSVLLTVEAQKDTVRYLDPWYRFNPLSSSSYSDPVWSNPFDFGSFAQRFPNSTAKDLVYGVAVVMEPSDKIIVDTPYYYVFIYDSLDAFDVIIDSILLSYDSSYYYRCLDIQARDSATFDAYTRQCLFKYHYNYENGIYSPGDTTFSCYEFLFDTPYVTSENSIYVGQKSGHITAIGGSIGLYFRNIFLKETGSNNIYYKAIPEDFIGGPYYCLPNSSWSSIFRDNWGGIFPIVRLRCTLPRMVHETGRGGDHLSFAWQDHDDATGFQVAIYSAGTPEDSIVPIDATGTSHTFTGLTPGVNYLYSVRKLCHYATNSYDTVVTSDWFPPQQFYIASSDGIADIEAPRFSLNPNPAGESVTVTLEEPATGCRLELYDAAGRRVDALDLSTAATATTLDLKGLAAGTYHVRLTTPQGTAVKRLIVR